MPPDLVHLGVDVSKDSLDVHFLAQSITLPNAAAGIARLPKLIAKHCGSVQVICEATGGYGRALTKAPHLKNVALSVVNPRLPRDFARAHNRLAKTDRMDVAMLAACGAAMKPALAPARSLGTERLAALVSQRDALVEERARHKTRLSQASDRWLREQTARLTAHLVTEISKLEALMRKLIEADAPPRQKSSAS